MIPKRIHFSLEDEECSIEEINPQSEQLEKLASGNLSPEIKQYIEKNIKEDPNFTYLLVSALGAGEIWGPNINGDFFEEREILNSYKTFEKHGHVFTHHKNKDPTKSKGDVLLAHWNDRMKRVELIVRLNKHKAAKICQDIDDGKMWDVSMGCKVPYDVCSICGNVAKTTKDYCVHIENQKGKILPDGRKVYMYNKNPRFFDISFVYIGADRTAKTLLKIAGIDVPMVKKSEIDKEVPAEIISRDAGQMAALIMNEFNKVKEREKCFPDRVLDRFSSFKMPDLLSTLLSTGIVLKPREFQHVLFRQSGKEIPDEVFDYTNLPQLDTTDKFTPFQGGIDIKIIKEVTPRLKDRSGLKQYLYPRLIKMASTPEDFIAERDRVSRRRTMTTPAMLGAAALYKKYLDQVPMETAEGLDKKVKDNPWMLPVALTGSLAAMNMGGAKEKQDRVLQKTAGNLGGRIFAGIPAAYLMSDLARRTKSDNKLINFVAKHPNITAALGVGVTNTKDDWQAIRNAFEQAKGGLVTKTAAQMIEPKESPQKIYEQTKNLYDRYQNIDRKYGRFQKVGDHIIRSSNPLSMVGGAVDSLAGQAISKMITGGA